MSIPSLASQKSLFRGYDYFQNQKVLQIEQLGDTVYTGRVSGENEKVYHVTIDTNHPRKNSSCTCPYAAGRQVICKHMVALYFTAFPEEADFCKKQIEEYWVAEQKQEEDENKFFEYVYQMEKEELQEALIILLMNGPEWQYQQFLEEYLDRE